MAGIIYAHCGPDNSYKTDIAYHTLHPSSNITWNTFSFASATWYWISTLSVENRNSKTCVRTSVSVYVCAYGQKCVTLYLLVYYLQINHKLLEADFGIWNAMTGLIC